MYLFTCYLFITVVVCMCGFQHVCTGVGQLLGSVSLPTRVLDSDSVLRLWHRPLICSVTLAALLLRFFMLSLPKVPSLSIVCDEILSEVDFLQILNL